MCARTRAAWRSPSRLVRPRVHRAQTGCGSPWCDQRPNTATAASRAFAPLAAVSVSVAGEPAGEVVVLLVVGRLCGGRCREVVRRREVARSPEVTRGVEAAGSRVELLSGLCRKLSGR